MKKSEIDKIRNGMATGQGSESYETSDGHSYNISGAASVLQRLFNQVQNYSLTFPDDFPATREDDNPDSAGVTDDVDLVSEAEVQEAQEAVQYFEDKLGTLLSAFTGDDDCICDDDGNEVVTLPKAATSADKNADLPDVSS